MKLRYNNLDPTGNITTLIDTPVPAEARASVGAKLLGKIPFSQQVGFLTAPTSPGSRLRLEMAGGEFCGNATISAASLTALREGISPGEKRILSIEVSGSPKPIAVAVTGLTESACTGCLDMPMPTEIRNERLGDFTLPVVYFPGIAHVIAFLPIDRTDAEVYIKNWCDILKQDALGIMLVDEASLSMKPLVYVPACNSLYWESSCASGTSALGAYLYKCKGSGVYIISQPGGTLTIEAGNGFLRLTGRVEITDEGYIEI